MAYELCISKRHLGRVAQKSKGSFAQVCALLWSAAHSARLTDTAPNAISQTPDKAKRARAARRGSLLLGAALMLSLAALLVTQSIRLLSDQSRRANASAIAGVISDLAADFDLYVHQNAPALIQHATGLGGASASLSAPQLSAFLSTGWRMPISHTGVASAPYALALDGLDIGFGVSISDAGDTAIGILLVSLHAAQPERLLKDVQTALARKAKASGRIGLNSADEAAEGILGAPLSASQIALATPPLSGLNDTYVLRSARVGHESSVQMRAPLGFEQNALGAAHLTLSGVNVLEARSVQTSSLGCFSPAHGCSSAPDLRVHGASPLNALTVTGAMNVLGAASSASAAVAVALQASSMGVLNTIRSTDLLTLSTGATLNTLASRNLTAQMLVAQTLRATQATLATGATQSPATFADQVIATVARFAHINNAGGCVGC